MNDILIGYAIISAIVAVTTFLLCADEQFQSLIGKTGVACIFWGPILIYFCIKEFWYLVREEFAGNVSQIPISEPSKKDPRLIGGSDIIQLTSDNLRK